jgi:hypothetical protein
MDTAIKCGGGEGVKKLRWRWLPTIAIVDAREASDKANAKMASANWKAIPITFQTS